MEKQIKPIWEIISCHNGNEDVITFTSFFIQFSQRQSFLCPPSTKYKMESSLPVFIDIPEKDQV